MNIYMNITHIHTYVVQDIAHARYWLSGYWPGPKANIINNLVGEHCSLVARARFANNICEDGILNGCNSI